MDIGKHCQYCQQLDFLPIKCPICRHFYCQRHYPRERHNCLAKKKKKKTKRTKIGVKCQLPSCQKQTVTPYHCLTCNKYYCISHRFHDLH